MVAASSKNLTLWLLILGVVTGCETVKPTYEGQAPDQTKLSYIVNDAYFFPRGILPRPFESFVSEVDGTTISMISASALLELIPGNHNINVKIKRETFLWGWYSKIGARSIEFDAIEGLHYAVLGMKEEENVYIWVHEVETNRIVAGSSPPNLTYSCRFNSILGFYAIRCSEN